MAVAKTQGQGGISAIHVWLIVFVALWLAATVLLVIIYLDQGKKTTEIKQLQEENQKLIGPAERKLPQFLAAKGGKTVAGLLEEARSQTAEAAIGDGQAEASAVRQKLNEQLQRIRADSRRISDPAALNVNSYSAALDAMYGLLQTAADAGQKAEAGLGSLRAEMDKLREQSAQEKEGLAQQAQKTRADLAEVEKQRDEARRTYEKQVADVEQQLEKSKQQCSEDIQAQRVDSDRQKEAFKELTTRYQELQAKLGLAQAAPLPLGTARQADGKILTAKPGEDVVYIDLGARDHLTLGLQFAVYDALTGIPEDGRGKARVEVVSINEQSSECRIVQTTGRSLITAGDLVANPIYDRRRPLKFFVLGEFDLDGDNRNDPDGGRRIATLIENWGGKVDPDLSAKADFVVLGGPPARPVRSAEAGAAAEDDAAFAAASKAYKEYEDRVRSANALGVPTLTQSVFLNFLGYEW